jgi:hypothetical protein
MLNFYKNSENNKKIIHVLDALLDFSVRDWSHRDVDYELYKIINSPNVYEKIIRPGLYPIISKNSFATNEFVFLIRDLSDYIIYDTMSDFLFAKTINQPNEQVQLHKKMISVRSQIIESLFQKDLIDYETYSQQIGKRIKTLLD